jgi:phosphoglycolate phosphatase
MKKLVIFDLDGTLINTIADLANSTNYALKENGFPTHPIEEYKYFVGNGINKLFERALPQADRTPANIFSIRKVFLKHYNAHIADASRPYPGVRELLQQLQANGIKIAVASNKYQEGCQKIISTLFPDITFDAIHGQREGISTKPNPQIIYNILAETGFTPDDTLYCGDSDVDAATAKNAKVDGCSVLWGFRGKSEMEPFHPVYYAKNVADILKFTGINQG